MHPLHDEIRSVVTSDNKLYLTLVTPGIFINNYNDIVRCNAQCINFALTEVFP